MARRPKYNAHPDANQREIIDGLLVCGYVVVDASQWLDIADLLVYGPDIRLGEWRWLPVEIKTDSGKLTETQEAFNELYPGAVLVARTVEDVLAAFGRVAT